MIGIVVVSHSPALAQAAVELAAQMVPKGGPKVIMAAGTSEGDFGTDAGAISAAIAEADSGDGVVVLLDVGSALLTSELAVEFLDPELADRVVISEGPLVEGLLAAVVSASCGDRLEQVANKAGAGLVGKAAHLAGSADAPPLLDLPHSQNQPNRPQRLVWRTTVRNPHGLHVRPAAAIITALQEVDALVTLANATTGNGPVNADSLSRIASLEVRQGQVLEARISGMEAEKARGILAELATQDFGEDVEFARRVAQLGSGAEKTHLHIAEGAQRRCVIGPVERRMAVSSVGYLPGSPKVELERFTAAVTEVDEFLAGLSTSQTSEAQILAAQRVLLADREMQHGIVGAITAGFSAVDAVEQTMDEFIADFDVLDDEYLRARGQDMRSLRRMLLLSLQGQPLATSSGGEPVIWLLDELDVPGAMQLDPRTCLGVVATAGGASGHGAIMAMGRGIPVLTGHGEAAGLVDGQIVAFDPVTDEFWIEPGEIIRTEIERRNERRDAAAAQAKALAAQPALTMSGQHIEVYCNVGSIDDVEQAVADGADGIGMVRTELLYSAHQDLPSVAEQAETYAAISQLMGNRPVTIRVWDPAADKPVSFLPGSKETNPALGERGMRAMIRHTDAFADQLRAVARASANSNLQVLLPMVTSVSEVLWARQVLAQVSREENVEPVPLGIMVEVPAVAITARSFAPLVDFATVGTNDLAQYVLAADRNNARVRELVRQEVPAVLDLISMTADGMPGVPIGVCGDIASDPTATSRLINRGITKLSVRPGMVAEIKQAVRRVRDHG